VTSEWDIPIGKAMGEIRAGSSLEGRREIWFPWVEYKQNRDYSPFVKASIG